MLLLLVTLLLLLLEPMLLLLLPLLLLPLLLELLCKDGLESSVMEPSDNVYER